MKDILKIRNKQIAKIDSLKKLPGCMPNHRTVFYRVHADQCFAFADHLVKDGKHWSVSNEFGEETDIEALFSVDDAAFKVSIPKEWVYKNPLDLNMAEISRLNVIASNSAEELREVNMAMEKMTGDNLEILEKEAERLQAFVNWAKREARSRFNDIAEISARKVDKFSKPIPNILDWMKANVNHPYAIMGTNANPVIDFLDGDECDAFKKYWKPER